MTWTMWIAHKSGLSLNLRSETKPAIKKDSNGRKYLAIEWETKGPQRQESGWKRKWYLDELVNFSDPHNDGEVSMKLADKIENTRAGDKELLSEEAWSLFHILCEMEDEELWYTNIKNHVKTHSMKIAQSKIGGTLKELNNRGYIVDWKIGARHFFFPTKSGRESGVW